MTTPIQRYLPQVTDVQPAGISVWLKDAIYDEPNLVCRSDDVAALESRLADALLEVDMCHVRIAAVTQERDALAVEVALLRKQLIDEAWKHGGQRWIPCAERMPDSGETVMAYAVHFEYEMLQLRSDGLWDTSYGEKWQQNCVTHWMPLPAPPVQEQP